MNLNASKSATDVYNNLCMFMCMSKCMQSKTKTPCVGFREAKYLCVSYMSVSAHF